MHFKTDGTDKISIDWETVTALVSKQQLQVELTSGVRYLGELVASDPTYLTIRSGTALQRVSLADTVRITPIEDTILERFDVGLSAGYSFSKASEVTSVDFGLAVRYTTEKRRQSLDAELITTDDADADKTTRWSVDLGSRRLRKNRWFHGYIGSLEQNDALGVDLRTSIGVGGGRYVWQTNSRDLALIAGVLASREEIDSSSETNTTIEGLLSAEFELFRYAEPELDLSTRLDIIPNLSDLGRVRIEYDLTLRWEAAKTFSGS